MQFQAGLHGLSAWAVRLPLRLRTSRLPGASAEAQHAAWAAWAVAREPLTSHSGRAGLLASLLAVGARPAPGHDACFLPLLFTQNWLDSHSYCGMEAICMVQGQQHCGVTVSAEGCFLLAGLWPPSSPALHRAPKFTYN